MKKIKHSYNMQEQDEFLRRSDEYKEVYKTEMGKRVIDDILYYSAIDRTAFSSRGSEQTFFNLGKQSVGYHILNNLDDIQFIKPTTKIENEYE